MITESALPREFQFYHFGTITSGDLNEAKSNQALLAKDQLAVGIRFWGDRTGTLILLADRKIDESTCHELANVIAAKFAATSDERSVSIMISSPKTISEKQAELLLLIPNAVYETREYSHFLENKEVKIKAIILELQKKDLPDA